MCCPGHLRRLSPIFKGGRPMNEEIDKSKAISILNQIMELELAGVVRYTPVSYTHLDVYKRQA